MADIVRHGTSITTHNGATSTLDQLDVVDAMDRVLDRSAGTSESKEEARKKIAKLREQFAPSAESRKEVAQAKDKAPPAPPDYLPALDDAEQRYAEQFRIAWHEPPDEFKQAHRQLDLTANQARDRYRWLDNFVQSEAYKQLVKTNPAEAQRVYAQADAEAAHLLGIIEQCRSAWNNICATEKARQDAKWNEVAKLIPSWKNDVTCRREMTEMVRYAKSKSLLPSDI